MLGMNDVGRDLYLATADKSAIERRTQVRDKYRDAMMALSDTFAKRGIAVVMIKPSIYDDTAAIPKENAPGLGAALEGFGDIDQQIAEQFKFSTVDFGVPMRLINTKEQQKDPSFTIVGQDRVHPGPVGHLVMAYLFLKAQGVSGVVSDTEVDADTAKVLKAENCEVRDVEKGPDGLSFTLAENSLPFPVPEKAIAATQLVPFARDLNRQRLAVSKLPEGSYDLLIDGDPVGSFSSSELAGGIDLAENKLTPQYKQALAVASALKKKWGSVDKLRSIAFLEHGQWREGPRPVTLEQIKPKLDEMLIKSQGKSTEGYMKSQYEAYLLAKPLEQEFPAQIQAALDEARKSAVPKPHRFVLKRSSSSSAPAQAGKPSV